MKLSVLILLFVTLVWGTTFPIIRAASTHLSGVEISALRFLIAGLCMLPFTVNASRKAWRDGAVLGTIALLSYVTQAVGLEYITSNRSAFITSLNVLMVPFLGLFLGRRLNFQIVGAAVLACAGIGLMSWESGSSLLGDGATFACAVFYAVYVIVLSRRIGAHRTRTLAATQNVTMAIIGGVWLLIADLLHGGALTSLPARAESVWLSLLYLGVVASAGMLFLQAAGQRHVSAEKAAVIYAMEPVFAAVFGWWWLGEAMGMRGFIGGAMVVGAVILGEWRFQRTVPDVQVD
ncbi:MAG TPA: DMT family transporter [Gammaproteobacteria bacterium]|nr:DMT family transporter [Gammaproteobacteria bacterium]